MKYKAEVTSLVQFIVEADSEDEAREQVINAELDWFINSHSEWDMNNKVKIDPIKIHKIKEVA